MVLGFIPSQSTNSCRTRADTLHDSIERAEEQYILPAVIFSIPDRAAGLIDVFSRGKADKV